MKFFILFLLLAVIVAKAKMKGYIKPKAQKNQVAKCPLGVGEERLGWADEIEEPGCDDPSKNFTYTINAKRTVQFSVPENKVIYFDNITVGNDPENVTYYQGIDTGNPLYLDVIVYNKANDYQYEIQDPGKRLNVCDPDPAVDTWDYVVIKVAQGNLMPDGGCPVKADTYQINEKVDPITVTFPKMLTCGSYTLGFNLYRDDVWIFQGGYSFTIGDDDKCFNV